MARLVTLDVTNTCIGITHSVGYHYAQIAREHGLSLNQADINTKFRIAFKETCSSFPCFGRKHHLSSRQWWQMVVDGTLKNEVRNRELLVTIGHDLFEDFSGSKNWMVFPDVIPSLERIKSAGIILGVISNFDDRLRSILEGLKLSKYFDFILAAYEVSCTKPDVEIFELALRSAHVEPAQAIHIGDDYELDYLAARKAAMRSLLLMRNTKQLQQEEYSERPLTISSISEVLEYF